MSDIDIELEQKPVSVDETVKNIVKQAQENGKYLNFIKENYLIGDRTIKEWDKEFSINIPDSLDLHQHDKMLSHINELEQVASFHFVMSCAMLESLTSKNKSVYLEHFTQISEAYKAKGKKLPGAETLKSMSEFPTIEIQDSITYAKVCKTFWQTILDRIKFAEKVLQQFIINRGYSVKMGII